MEILTGLPSTSTVSCPQEQDARRVAIPGRYCAARVGASLFRDELTEN
jgi:hypothetical protein